MNLISQALRPLSVAILSLGLLSPGTPLGATEMAYTLPLVPSETAPSGQTFLHWIAYQGRLEVLKRLIKFQPTLVLNLDLRDPYGFTPLMWAAYAGESAVLEYLLSRGADPHLTCWNNENTALHYAAFNGHLECVRSLLRVTALDPDAKNKLQATPLMCAARAGRAHVVRFLLQQNADALARDKTLQTPLHHAAQQGRLGAVTMLVKYLQAAPQLIELKDQDGHTPLMCAAQNDQLRIVILLLKAGAQVPVVPLPDGSSFLYWMITKNARYPWLRYTMKQLQAVSAPLEPLESSSPEPLMIAATCQSPGLVRFLLTAQVPADLPDHNGNTPLHHAAYLRHKGNLRLLLSLPQVEVNALNQMHQTPLLLAAQQGHTALVKALIYQKADLTLPDAQGNTPLHHAVRNRHFKASRVLIIALKKTNQPVDSRNQEAQTPLMLAQAHHNQRILREFARHPQGAVQQQANTRRPKGLH